MNDKTSEPTDDQRTARLTICRASDAMHAAIELIDTASPVKNELLNLNTVLLRAALAVSDGFNSPVQLRRF